MSDPDINDGITRYCFSEENGVTRAVFDDVHGVAVQVAIRPRKNFFRFGRENAFCALEGAVLVCELDESVSFCIRIDTDAAAEISISFFRDS